MRLPRCSWFFALTVASALIGTSASPLAAFQDEDFFPGLIGRYAAGEESVERVDDVLSFDWGSSAPDERLPSGEFQVEWTGNLLVRLPGRHRFHAFVAGDVSVEIDGTPVFSAAKQWGFASGEAFQLSAGDHSIRVTYKTPTESDKHRAKLAVFWSSDQFTLEPLPADVLYRDEPAADVAAAKHGGRLFDSLRCAACHRDPSDTKQLPTLSAPALDRISPNENRAILTARLQGHGNSRMPYFDLTPAEQESVVEYLLSVSKGAHKESGIEFKDGDVDGGFKLLNSLGCVACHSVPMRHGGAPERPSMNATFDPYAAPAYDGPSLQYAGSFRTASWLDRWLKDPKSLNSDHRMPVFQLSSNERRQLVAALSQAKTGMAPNGNPIPKEEYSAEQGRKIIQAANCAACHRIPGMDATTVRSLTAADFENTASGCLSVPSETASNLKANGARVPSFARILDAPALGTRRADRMSDRQAIAAWFRSGERHSSVSMADRGNLLLQRNGCVACHDRNSQQGLSAIANKLQKAHPELAGQSQGLIPPSLTAVGDKLNDDYLVKAVAGEHKERRLPWLLVRMPKFTHSDADRAALLHYLKTTDRIPDEADAVRGDILADVDLVTQNQASTEDLLLGNTLTGAGGFNCVSCHKAGTFEPRNVALGTRGSDIMTMGERIRPRFFQRWMKNPIRVVAGIEMPAIKKAMPDILDGSLPRQMGAIWKALSDKRFTPPTVTSRFEQVVNVRPGDKPRIIRDVFTIGTDKDRTAVARALAVGFGNGHNILIDLNDMQVRQWTMGEFARQRTEGKSWYWDMPGFPLKAVAGAETPFTLEVDGQDWTPLEDEGRKAELLSYQTLPDGVEITVAWHFLPSIAAASQQQHEPHFSKTVWEARATEIERLVTVHRFQQHQLPTGANGWKQSMTLQIAPRNAVIRGCLSMFRSLPDYKRTGGSVEVSRGGWSEQRIGTGQSISVTSTAKQRIPAANSPVTQPISTSAPANVTSTPGFDGVRLPIDTSVMPTSMTWLPDGRFAFTSLKGHVWIANAEPQESVAASAKTEPLSVTLFEEGLAAPFGILADGDSIIVAHKPEILRLRDTDGDGRADTREVVASGWGFNDNYHDWTGGIVRGENGNIYAGLGSDYSQKNRPKNQDRWRGGVVKIDPSGIVTPMGMSMRYPMGLAIDNRGRLFATDNQGVQNTFNEINHIIPGRHYGVPSTHQPVDGLSHESPAIMVPHPWTRSVNSILFLPDTFPVEALRGHGIGCEYDSRFLIRFTVQDVDGVLQGASYRFSLPNLDAEAGTSNFIGPISSAVSPKGEIFIGSIWDSGWQGGRNTGGITKLTASLDGLPNGIRELTATANGFVVEFFEPMPQKIAEASSWSIQGLTRKWGGGYATPDSGQHTLQPRRLKLDSQRRRLTISVDNLKAGYLYSLTIDDAVAAAENLWPAEAHYSMKVVPK